MTCKCGLGDLEETAPDSFEMEKDDGLRDRHFDRRLSTSARRAESSLTDNVRLSSWHTDTAGVGVGDIRGGVSIEGGPIRESEAGRSGFLECMQPILEISSHKRRLI